MANSYSIGCVPSNFDVKGVIISYEIMNTSVDKPKLCHVPEQLSL